MNGMMVSGVHIKVVLARRQTNMGDSHFRSRPGLGSRGKYYQVAFFSLVGQKKVREFLVERQGNFLVLS